RKRQSLVLEHSLADTITLGFSDRLARLGWIPRAEEERSVKSAIESYSIRATSGAQVVGTLSGGNQQKAVIARWLGREPKLLILDEPTRGVDVGAKAEIHRLIEDLAKDGRAVLLISSDLPELLALSDRISVLRSGRIARSFVRGDVDESSVLLAASGVDSEVSP
ncbi:MAG: ATP-binding cassette domain-containing protein, partial [Planctomycetota bacterium]